MTAYIPRTVYIPQEPPNEYLNFGDWAIITINKRGRDNDLLDGPASDLLTQAASSGLVHFRYFRLQVPNPLLQRFKTNQGFTTVLVASRTPIGTDDGTRNVIRQGFFGQ